ncbi:MAG: hypothetical protein WDM90_18005 [Ferruginibacter sp.]
MIKRLPIKDVAAIFSMSFKPAGIKEFLKLLGIEAYANMGLAFAGFSLDDFIKANKGDLLIAFGDFKTQKMVLLTQSKILWRQECQQSLLSIQNLMLYSLLRLVIKMLLTN